MAVFLHARRPVQPPHRTATLPLVLIVLALFGSIALPWAIEGHLTRLWADISDIADPARTLVADVQAAVGLEMAGVRGYLISGEPAYRRIYADAHDRRQEAIAQLTSIAARLEDRTRALVKRLGELVSSADPPVRALFEGRIAPRDLIAQLPTQQARFRDALDTSAEIDRELRTTIDVRRSEIRRTERLRLAVIFAMTLTAFGAAMSVVSLGRQYRHAYNAELRAHADADAARHQLEREHAELERITASRAALVRGFTHDVKNPIGAAAGDLQLLQMEAAGPLSEKQRASLNRASRALGASLALIEDLLTLARAETMEMARAEIDVRSLLREVVDEHRAAASAKSLELTVDTSAHTPSIETDPARVRQILGNLLSNAVKYTSRGTVAVRVRRQGRERRDWIAIDVADTGPGIPEAQMAELFKEFHRLGSSHGTNGSGIGLAISQRLARALDGDISVESTEGRGSVFTLWLPLYPSRAAS